MKFKAALGALLFSAMTTASAQASSVTPNYGFDLSLAGNTNVPVFTLSNTSDPAIQLLQFTFTIGDTTRHFDFVDALTSPAGGTATLNTPDSINNGLRNDVIDITFTGFDTGESVSFEADIDVDPSSNVVQDFRTVFFNNGTALNSVATAFFSNGSSLALTLPDNPPNFQYSISAVPLPAALPLFAIGLAGMGILARRRKSAA